MKKSKKQWLLPMALPLVLCVATGCQTKENIDTKTQQFQRKEVAVELKELASYNISAEALFEEVQNTVSDADYEQIISYWATVEPDIGTTIEFDEISEMKPIFDTLVTYPLNAFEDHYIEGQYDVSWAFSIMSSDDYKVLVELAKEVEELEADSYFESAAEVWDEINTLIGKYQSEVDAYFAEDQMPLIPSDFYETYAAYNIEDGHFQYSQDAYDYIDEIMNPVSETDHFIYMYLWDHISQLFPDEYMEYMVGYDLTSDGWGGDYAMVWQDEEDERKWHLTVDPADAIDRAGDFSLYQMDETLVHEFCHILTLNYTQMLPEVNEESPTYTTDEGTLREESYLNQFYQQFWKDIAAEYLVESEYVDAYDDERLYADDPDAFVTDYAASHPAEDIAESFIYFVTLDKPEGTMVQDDKIRFFYQYPELIQLREQMRQVIEVE